MDCLPASWAESAWTCHAPIPTWSTRRSKSASARAAAEAPGARCVPAASGAGGSAVGSSGGAGQAQAPPTPDPARSGVWRSDDKGKTWRIMSNNNNRPMYYSQIRVDPSNDQIIYTCGAPFYKSLDGGKNVPGSSGYCAQRPSCGVDRSQERESPADRHGWRPGCDLRPGRHLGVHQYHAAGADVRGRLRHAEALLRLRRPAGQRQLVRPQRGARAPRGLPTPIGSGWAAATGSMSRSIRPTTIRSMPNRRTERSTGWI